MLRSSLTRLSSRLRPSSSSSSPSSSSASSSAQPPPQKGPEAFNTTPEQRGLAKRLKRQRRWRGMVYERLGWIRSSLILLSILNILLLPLSFPTTSFPHQLHPQLGRSTYIDENALQPGQVTTQWGWEDVKGADGWLRGLEGVWFGEGEGEVEGQKAGKQDGGEEGGRRDGGTEEQRANYLLNELRALNIPASTQSYTWTYPSSSSSRHPSQRSPLSSLLSRNQTTSEPGSKIGQRTSSGTNVIATISPPRSSGTEIILLTVPWISLISASDQALVRAPARGSQSQPSPSDPECAKTDTQPNLRGVALALAFAKFLRGQNHWAKEIVIVFGDGDIGGGATGGSGGEEGIAAWLAEWSGEGREGLASTPLISPPPGTIWTSFSIDYPGHSFSHIGIFHEGINGALPNQDLINTVVQVGRSGGVGVEVRVGRESSDLIPLTSPSWLPAFAQSVLGHEIVTKYARGVRHLSTHFGQAALGKSTGAHGVFARHKIDGFTLFAEPSTGPHGFYAFGILLESSLRSCNNLLERLHASFFFYLMPFAGWFIPIGGYLPAAIMLAASVTIGGLGQWVGAGWEMAPSKAGDNTLTPVWIRVDRRLDVVLPVVAAAFAAGQATLWLATSGVGVMIASPGAPIVVPFSLIIIWRLLIWVRNRCINDQHLHAICRTTSAITHILAGAGTSCIAMINFPQALLALAVFIPTLALAQPQRRPTPMWNKALRFLAVLTASPENLTLLFKIGRSISVATPWEDFTAAIARDRVVLGRNTLDGWLGFLWPVQLLAGTCILLDS